MRFTGFAVWLDTQLHCKPTCAGDTQLAIALAQSLIAAGRCDAATGAGHYGAAFDVSRGYRHMESGVYEALKEGVDHTETASRFLIGGFGPGGAARITPVGLAYRHADVGVLHTAVEDALMCSHTHPLGIDAAFIIAAAAAWLCKHCVSAQATTARDRPVTAVHTDDASPPNIRASAAEDALGHEDLPSASQQHTSSFDLATPSTSGSTAEFAHASSLASPGTAAELLDYLIPLAGSDDMRKRLRLMRMWVNKAVKPGTRVGSPGWKEYLTSDDFAAFEKVYKMIADPLQHKGTEAVAAALWALCCHWEDPEGAVIAAVHMGGYCRTIAGMTGNMRMGMYHIVYIMFTGGPALPMPS